MVSKQTQDVVLRATQLYDEKLLDELERTHVNDVVAIEPDSCECFFGKTLSEAIQVSRAVCPDRLAFAMRVGHDTSVHIGVLKFLNGHVDDFGRALMDLRMLPNVGAKAVESTA